MNAIDLTGPQLAALRALVAAQCRDEPRPIRTSNRTTLAADLHRHEMLTVQTVVADQLVDLGLAFVTNDVLRTLALTTDGLGVAYQLGMT